MLTYYRCIKRNRRNWVAAGTLVIGALALGPQSAWAQNCIQDRWKADGNKQNLTCTANDVRIAEAANIRDLDGGTLSTCTNGETFSFLADFTVELTAQERFDIGLYFATDGDELGTGDGAISGTCSVDTITEKLGGNPDLGSGNFIQLDTDDPGDLCGDIDADHNPQVVTVQVDDVLCQDSDGDEFLNLPNCTSWRQTGANETCVTYADAFPGSPSKCNCDPDFNIPVRVEVGTISVVKTASPTTLPEPGGLFTFTVTVQNESQFTDIDINKMCDSDHGEIFDMTGTGCPDGTLGTVETGSDCAAVTLSPDDGLPGGPDESICTFDALITSDGPTQETDVVTVFGVDQSPDANPVQGSDNATIEITDAPPNAIVTKGFSGINCVNATYDVEVENTSTADDLTLNTLIDSAFGDITSIQGDVTLTDCAVPQTIAAGGATYSCSFDADFCAASHSNKVTAALNDEEGNNIAPMSTTVIVDVTATVQ